MRVVVTTGSSHGACRLAWRVSRMTTATTWEQQPRYAKPLQVQPYAVALLPAPARASSSNGEGKRGEDLGIGRGTMEFLLFGAPKGEQRLRALAATRSLLCPDTGDRGKRGRR